MAVVIVVNTDALDGVEVTSQVLDDNGQVVSQVTQLIPKNTEEFFAIGSLMRIISIKERSRN